MYLVMFSAVNSTFVNWMQQNLDIEYGLWLGVLSAATSLCGLFFVDRYVKQTGKQSVFVWLLVLVFFITIIVAPLAAFQESQSKNTVANSHDTSAE